MLVWVSDESESSPSLHARRPRYLRPLASLDLGIESLDAALVSEILEAAEEVEGCPSCPVPCMWGVSCGRRCQWRRSGEGLSSLACRI